MAAGFARCSMPSPACNDTGTALGQDGSNWSRDPATLTLDFGGHGACGWCGSYVLHPYTKFEVCRPCRSEDMAHDVCQHQWAWWPWPLTFWPESGLLVASKVGNIPSKIGHVRPLRSRIICYVRDKRCRTDRQMDGRTVISNAYCPIPTDGGITNEWHLFRSRSCRFHFISFVSLTMPPTTRNGHTTSNHCKQKPNPKLKITKIHEMHIAHKT